MQRYPKITNLLWFLTNICKMRKKFRDSNMNSTKVSKVHLKYSVKKNRKIIRDFNTHLTMAGKLWELWRRSRVPRICFRRGRWGVCTSSRRRLNSTESNKSPDVKSWTSASKKTPLWFKKLTQNPWETSHVTTLTFHVTPVSLAPTTSLKPSLWLSRQGPLLLRGGKKRQKRKRLRWRSRKVWKNLKDPAYNRSNC